MIQSAITLLLALALFIGVCLVCVPFWVVGLVLQYIGLRLILVADAVHYLIQPAKQKPPEPKP